MDIKNILSCVDHTILSQIATFEDVKKICDDGIKYNVASVCIPPAYVKQAKEYVDSKIKICTVIGFPNGYNSTAVKVFETEDAIKNGAEEIDMVINVGWVKSKRFSDIKEEIKEIKNACKDKILKVIVETCLLNEQEKIELCKIVTECNADFIKTSTGFSKSGANIEDIKLFSQHLGSNVKIKASGGISSLESAEKFINAGASRLGTSKIVNIVKENRAN